LDNLTHSLFAATLARTPLARAGRGTTAALLLASNAPDIDIIATAGGTAKYLEWHRGMTHGPLGIVGLGVVAAAVVWIGRRKFDRPWPAASTEKPRGAEPDASFAMLCAVSMIGVLLHVLMDLPTSYGTRLLSPFSWRWFGADWMPIVDIYLLMVLVIGLLGRSTASQRRAKATLVLLLMATNYGVRAFTHYQALELAPRLFGPTLPPPCDPPASATLIDSWPRAAAPSSAPPGRRCLVEIAAMPSFTSPFTWRIIAQMSNAYEIHDINVLDRRYREAGDSSDVPWRTTLRYPSIWTPTVAQAATTHLGQVFLGFSRFPAARSASDAHGVTIVRWTDMRFAGVPFGLDDRRQVPGPFTATVRVDADGRVIAQSLGLR
jgi:membrane-bound metal-dependent hydrolase YbcI (DUF457 family)